MGRKLKQTRFVAVKLSEDEYALLSSMQQRLGYRETASEVIRELIREGAAGRGVVYKPPATDYGAAVLFTEPDAPPAKAPAGKLDAPPAADPAEPDQVDALIDHLARAGRNQPKPRPARKKPAPTSPKKPGRLNGKPQKAPPAGKKKSTDTVNARKHRKGR